MQIERAEGIVLRWQAVTETSLIITWYTRECGKLRTLAKGARRPKSPFRGQLDLFYVDELLFRRSRRSDLHLLDQCSLLNPHLPLRDSVQRLAAAEYVCELVDLSTPVEDPQPALYNLLADTLTALETATPPALLLWYEMKLLAAIGWKPDWTRLRAVETRRLLEALAATTLAGAMRVRLTPSQLTRAQTQVWKFWDEQVGRSPRARPLLAALQRGG